MRTLDIPFTNGPIAMDRVPHFWLKLRGSRPIRFGMDTGSTGIVDAAGGYVGFGWNGRLSSGYGGVTPGMSDTR